MWDLTVFTRSDCGSGLACDSHVYLHNAVVLNGNHDAKRAALDLLLILGAPLNHAGRNSTGIWGVNRQGCRFSRPAPWMARGGGPPNHWRISGTPSLGEVPSGGARAFCLLLRFSKVSRRQGGTLSGRYLHNGYALGLIQHPSWLSGRLRSDAATRQASSHIWMAEHQMDMRRLSDRRECGGSAIGAFTDTPYRRANPLPHCLSGAFACIN